MGDVEEDADAQPLQVVREMRCAVCGKRHGVMRCHAIIGTLALTAFMVFVTLLISCEPAGATSDGGEAHYGGERLQGSTPSHDAAAEDGAVSHASPLSPVAEDSCAAEKAGGQS